MVAVTVSVRGVWDAEAKVWVAESHDLRGLILEAATHEELLRKLEVAIPELISESGFATAGLPEIPVYLMSEVLTKVRVAV